MPYPCRGPGSRVRPARIFYDHLSSGRHHRYPRICISNLRAVSKMNYLTIPHRLTMLTGRRESRQCHTSARSTYIESCRWALPRARISQFRAAVMNPFHVLAPVPSCLRSNTVASARAGWARSGRVKITPIADAQLTSGVSNNATKSAVVYRVAGGANSSSHASWHSDANHHCRPCAPTRKQYAYAQRPKLTRIAFCRLRWCHALSTKSHGGGCGAESSASFE